MWRQYAGPVFLSLLMSGINAPSGADAQTRASSDSVISVLVPALANGTGKVSLFGDSVAALVLARLENTPGFKAMSWEKATETVPTEIRGPICIRARQVAVRAGVNAVLCGSFVRAPDGDFVVDVSIITTPDQKPRLKTFKAANAAQAAIAIVQELSALRKP